MPLVGGPNTRITNSRWRRPPSWNNGKITISQPQFQWFRQNLARRRSLTLLTNLTVENSKFRKSKLAAQWSAECALSSCLSDVNEWRVWENKCLCFAAASISTVWQSLLPPPRLRRAPVSVLPTSAGPVRSAFSPNLCRPPTINHVTQDSLMYIVTLLCDCELVFEVTGTRDGVEKAHHDIESYIALSVGNAPDLITPAPLMAYICAYIRCKKPRFQEETDLEKIILKNLRVGFTYHNKTKH